MFGQFIKKIIFVILIAIIIFSAGYYVVTKDSSVIDENKDTNVPNNTKKILEENLIKAIDKDTGLNTTEISGYGYKLNIDLEELADQIIEESSTVRGGSIEEYLTNSLTRTNLLKKMIKAELVTQYPDLRKREKIGNPVSDDDFQGAIKIVRHKENEEEIIMEYRPFEEFKKDVEDASGENNDVLNYFSINGNGELVVAYYQGNLDINISGKRELGKENNLKDNYDEENGDTLASDTYKDYSKIEDFYTKDIQDAFMNSNEKKNGKLTYTYSTKAINYRNAILKYTMPFEYLWTFLVTGKDEEFVNNLADLVLDSSITIGVYDNTTITETEYIKGHNENIWEATRNNYRTYTFIPGNPGVYNEKKDMWIGKTDDQEIISGPYYGNWRNNITTTLNYDIEYNKTYTNLVEIQLTNLDIWTMKYNVEYTYTTSEETNPSMTDYSFVRNADEDERFVAMNKIASSYSPSEYWNNIPWYGSYYSQEQNQTETRTQKNTNQYFYSSIENFQSKTYVKEGNPEVQERTNKLAEDGDWDYPNFCTLFIDASKARSNINGIETWLFEILEENESTISMVDLTRYLMYCALDLNFGVKEYDFKVHELSAFKKMQLSGGLAAYLKQFSHSNDAPQSADKQYYLMYGDGKGWPTIGDADIQWKSHHNKFNKAGKVLKNGKEQDVESIEAYVNEFLKKGVESNQYSDAEIKEMQIYIEKEIVDQIGNEIQSTYLESVKKATSSLNLSQQQLYALTAIQYNFGFLPTRNGYKFNEVYLAGAALYEINSWQHNKFIWDNWWSYLGGNATGHIPARDAAFETYIKGVFDFSESDAGQVFGRKYYVYYTKEQVNRFPYAPQKRITRSSNNEEEIFSYVENIQGDSILSYAELIHRQMEEYKYTYSLTFSGQHALPATAEDAWNRRTTCCATFVDWVLIEAGYQESKTLIHGATNIFDAFKDKFEVIESYNDLQPGDIIFTTAKQYSIVKYNGRNLHIGHTQIYAGNETWYNAGSTNAIQRESPYVDKSYARDRFQIALRPTQR